MERNKDASLSRHTGAFGNDNLRRKDLTEDAFGQPIPFVPRLNADTRSMKTGVIAVIHL